MVDITFTSGYIQTVLYYPLSDLIFVTGETYIKYRDGEPVVITDIKTLIYERVVEYKFVGIY